MTINLPSLPLQWMTFDPETGEIPGAEMSARYLSDLKGLFEDSTAYEQLASENPLVYKVYSVTAGEGAGGLQYGMGVLMPGKVGDEYYFTKGHYHAWREAAEVYIGLCGRGVMLLEDEDTGDTRLLSLNAHEIVYVPGFTAHRTINTGQEPLIYLGVYPAQAGHDYGAIAKRNFLSRVVERNGKPTLIKK